MVAHASVPWTAKHFDDNFADVEKTMTEQVLELLPGLPSAAHKSRLIRWRYSQVQEPYTNTPGHVVLRNNNNNNNNNNGRGPLVLCAGDGFTHSNFDGCVESAFSVVECLKMRFPSMYVSQ